MTTYFVVLILMLSGLSSSALLIQEIFATTMEGTTPSLETVFNQLEPSTVRILNTIPSNLFNPQVQNLTELGTGFVFDEMGHIITAYHLLSGATTVDVVDINGVRYNATIVGADPFSDVAILKMGEKVGNFNANLALTQEGVPVSNDTSRPVVMGNSSNLRIGQPVVTIGYNFGDSTPAMTGGLVSKTDYLLAFPAGGFSIPNVIQSDVTVNPGNSGGPLIDPTGKVVGMIYGRLNPLGVPLGQFPGMTAAIPSNIVDKVASSIVQNGYYLHPGIGIIGETLTPDLSQRLVTTVAIPSDLQGVFVNKIQRGGTADRAGVEGSTTNEYNELVGGDIITAIDGIPVKSFEELLAYLQERKQVGDTISFSVYRDGQFVDLRGVVQAFIPSTSR
jgi:S1-C subfamily serine protease